MIKNLVFPSTETLQTLSSSRTARGLSVGQTVKAHVVTSLSRNRFILNIKGQNIYVKSNILLKTGSILNLKVISLSPKPTMEIVSELGGGEVRGDLFPPVITVKDGANPELTRGLFEKITDTVDATLVTKKGNDVKIRVGNEILEGIISDSNFNETTVKLKVVSLYPKIILEVASNQPPPRPSNLAGYIEKYAGIGEFLFPEDSGSTEPSPAQSDKPAGTMMRENSVPLKHGASLEKAETWLEIIKDIAGEVAPRESNSTPTRDLSRVQLNDIRVLAREINNIIASDKQFILPLSFPAENGKGRADIIISGDEENKHAGRNKKSVFSALVCLHTDLLGTLKMRVKLDHDILSVSIKGDTSAVVKLISDNLDELGERLQKEGFRLGSLSAAYEAETLDIKEAVAIELLNTRAPRMDVVA